MRTLIFAIALALPVAANAAIFTVRPDGTGDFTSIGDALAVAEAGDEIEVHAGTYVEHDLVGPPLVSIRGVDGVHDTIVDVDGHEYGFVALEENGLWELEGFSIIRAANAGISIEAGGHQTIRHCMVSRSGVGVYAREFGGVLENLTLVYNESPVHSGSGLSLTYSTPIIRNCISAFNAGYGLVEWAAHPDPLLFCNDIYGNGGGDYFQSPDRTGFDGNLSVDPLLCSPLDGDPDIAMTSPCADGYHPDDVACGTIGAGDPGCFATPTRPASWGSLKHRFTPSATD